MTLGDESDDDDDADQLTNMVLKQKTLPLTTIVDRFPPITAKVSKKGEGSSKRAPGTVSKKKKVETSEDLTEEEADVTLKVDRFPPFLVENLRTCLKEKAGLWFYPSTQQLSFLGSKLSERIWLVTSALLC